MGVTDTEGVMSKLGVRLCGNEVLLSIFVMSVELDFEVAAVDDVGRDDDVAALGWYDDVAVLGLSDEELGWYDNVAALGWYDDVAAIGWHDDVVALGWSDDVAVLGWYDDLAVLGWYSSNELRTRSRALPSLPSYRRNIDI